jgi:hypothetical protein
MRRFGALARLKPMITIAITPKAFAIIVATLPHGYKAELSPDGNGGFVATLSNGILDRLEVLRAPGESYNDVIIRAARALRDSYTANAGHSRPRNSQPSLGVVDPLPPISPNRRARSN